MSTTRTRITVDGRVQGVYFRDSAHCTAAGLGLAGWVRNLRDGRVEAVFEGEQDAVQRAVDWARLGPERALVTKFEEFAEEPEGLVDFEIRY